MILWRLLPWRAQASPTDPGGALWFPRELKGAGRHDNPELYGCMYAAEDPVSSVAEALAPFRGVGVLQETMLVRAGLPLALARLELTSADGLIDVDAPHECLIDLDNPRMLTRANLRPSEVATNERSVTQRYAARLFIEHPHASGLRWWSTLEAGLINLTLFDRAGPMLSITRVEELTLDHPAARDAAELLGLDPAA